mmetsp:Transcript_22496/g.49681  ORF Transcript_22496/g.49681 Transcript_22496/m.49681 type:complete len:464 (-) Transcript_22496:53-1444(-)
MYTSSLCKCICGTGKRERIDQNRTLGTDLELEEVDEAPFQHPQITGLLSYSAVADQPLRGAAIRQGPLWYLSTEEQVERVTFSLYINGFAFTHNEHEYSISLSPFSLVRNCKFQSGYTALNLSDFKIFKISLFTQGICYYYGVRGEDERQAEEARSLWVLDISRAMRLVTQSLFPPFSISCDPVESSESTVRRLMAGYVVYQEDCDTVSVLYCELHPQENEQAKLVLYENESCQTPVMEVYLSDRSICCEKVGINCSCFCVEDHQLATRTLAERKLWMRAISNVKVKLQNRAPNPTQEELEHYRLAIKERISALRSSMEIGHAMDALLQRNPRRGYSNVMNASCSAKSGKPLGDVPGTVNRSAGSGAVEGSQDAAGKAPPPQPDKAGSGTSPGSADAAAAPELASIVLLVNSNSREDGPPLPGTPFGTNCVADGSSGRVCRSAEPAQPCERCVGSEPEPAAAG